MTERKRLSEIEHDESTAALVAGTLDIHTDEVEERVRFTKQMVRLADLGNQVGTASDYHDDWEYPEAFDLVESLSEAYREQGPDAAPPVVLAPAKVMDDDPERLWVCDGYHRLAGANDADLEEVPAWVAALTG